MKIIRTLINKISPIVNKKSQDHYLELLQQKEKQIEQLNLEKNMLMRNLMKNAKKQNQLLDYSKRVIQINKELSKEIKKCR